MPFHPFRVPAIAALLIAVALGNSAARAESPSPAAQSLRAEATKLFKKKKFAEACEKFRQAADATPDDAAVLTDLGLCQHKLGQDKDAAVTNLRAIEIASRDPGRIDDPAATRVRRHAYFNLDQAKADAVAVIPGDDRGTKCETITPPPGCARSFEVCGVAGSMGFRMRTYSRINAKVALTRAAATWTDEEIIQHNSDDPSFGGPPSDKPQSADDDKVIFIADFQDDARTEGCDDVSGWTCETSDGVRAAAEACLKSGGAGGAGGAATPLEDSACFKKACAALDKHPSKAVAREKRRADKTVSGCSKDLLNGIGSHYLCSIVYANACTGLLAVLCDSEGPGNQESSHIDEYVFDPAPPAASGGK